MAYARGARRMSALKNDFNRRRTNEDRKAWTRFNQQADREVDADPALHAARMKWLDAGYRTGFRADFPNFAQWRKEQAQ